MNREPLVIHNGHRIKRHRDNFLQYSQVYRKTSFISALLKTFQYLISAMDKDFDFHYIYASRVSFFSLLVLHEMPKFELRAANSLTTQNSKYIVLFMVYLLSFIRSQKKCSTPTQHLLIFSLFSCILLCFNFLLLPKCIKESRLLNSVI